MGIIYYGTPEGIYDETYDNALKYKIIREGKGGLLLTEPFKKSFLRTQQDLCDEGTSPETIRISKMFNRIVREYIQQNKYDVTEGEVEDLARFCWLALNGIDATHLAIARRQWGR